MMEAGVLTHRLLKFNGLTMNFTVSIIFILFFILCNFNLIGVYIIDKIN